MQIRCFPWGAPQQVLDQVIAAQNLIGWDLFLHRCVATEWEEVLDLHSALVAPSPSDFPPGSDSSSAAGHFWLKHLAPLKQTSPRDNVGRGG